MGLLIDESALERVEVVKGPYSVLYGSQAIGGIVNFITKKGGDKLASGVVKAVYNSATARLGRINRGPGEHRWI